MVEQKASGNAERKVVDDEHGGRLLADRGAEGKGALKARRATCVAATGGGRNGRYVSNQVVGISEADDSW
jgi:hypothetical protein